MSDSVSTLTHDELQYIVVTSDEPQSRSLWVNDYTGSVVRQHYEVLKKSLRRYVLASNDAKTIGIAPRFQITAQAERDLQLYVDSLSPFTYLSDGWSGPGSKAPSSMSLWQAVAGSFSLIALWNFPLPKPKLLPDGTLGVYWKFPGCYASVDFEEDGVHIWSAGRVNGVQAGEWDMSNTNNFPGILGQIVKHDDYPGADR